MNQLDLAEDRVSILTLLQGEGSAPAVGCVGSPSSTNDIMLEILEYAQESSILGQLVYMVMRQDDYHLLVMGQVSQIKTQNRWHEDQTFRGLIKRKGQIPHLSGDADVRCGHLVVQACFELRKDGGHLNVEEGMLLNSPSTGMQVYRMTDAVMAILLKAYGDELVILGHVFGTTVKMPFLLKHFSKGLTGAGEAYHIGVFGRTGSGKSGTAAYLLLGYARHKDMGILVLDPQGQFSNDKELPFPLQNKLKQMNRPHVVYRLTTQLRLPATNTELFVNILNKRGFFKHLQISGTPNQNYAAQEMLRLLNEVLRETRTKLSKPPDNFLVLLLNRLHDDEAALRRIYTGASGFERLRSVLAQISADVEERRRLSEASWQPVLDLFLEYDSRNEYRNSLEDVLKQVATSGTDRPVVFLDLSGAGTQFRGSEEMIALFLNQIGSLLTDLGEKAFNADHKLNCLVMLDEAHRYASARGSEAGDEMHALTKGFVDAVRTTRKYGLGYMFVTQNLASLHPAILQQLRLSAFGYGLTMGSEFAKLEQLVGDKQALSLYRGFVDPAGSRRKQYPFMMIGPASPLSFTGSPLFVQVFTTFPEFEQANPWLRQAPPSPPRLMIPPTEEEL